MLSWIYCTFLSVTQFESQTLQYCPYLLCHTMPFSRNYLYGYGSLGLWGPMNYYCLSYLSFIDIFFFGLHIYLWACITWLAVTQEFGSSIRICSQDSQQVTWADWRNVAYLLHHVNCSMGQNNNHECAQDSSRGLCLPLCLIVTCFWQSLFSIKWSFNVYLMAECKTESGDA